MKSLRTFAVHGAALTVAAFVLLQAHGRAQDAPPAAATTESADAVRALQDQVHQLRSLMEEMREENAESRAEMRRLRQLEEDNRRLKAIVADQALDLRALKDVLAKNGYGPR